MAKFSSGLFRVGKCSVWSTIKSCRWHCKPIASQQVLQFHTVLPAYRRTSEWEDYKLCSSTTISYSSLASINSASILCVSSNVKNNFTKYEYCNCNITHFSSASDEPSLTLQNYLLCDYLDSLLLQHQEAQRKQIDQNDMTEAEAKECNNTIINLAQVASLYTEYRQVSHDLQELDAFGTEDSEMKEMIVSERKEGLQRMKQLEAEILFCVVPPERGDHNDVIIEVKAGVGGQEAMLFTKDLFGMYMNYAAYRRWQFTPLQYEEVDLGGVRKATAMISGDQVYKTMKYEGGVHRVQRVPKTEKSGRIHTSTVTVAILPQPTEVDIQIDRKDLKIDTFKASGAGGQHVNKTDSAVRIKHLPTGTVVECQVDRSQLKNRATAMNLLRSKLYERELEEQMRNIHTKRKLQVGTSSRSEKIRTYNFPQDRISDHRISESSHNMDNFLSGGEQLDNMVDMLLDESRRERLQEILEEFKEGKS